uniref:Formin-like protein n=1 Tax=Anthurium amnicola TaxID=1678845 RepID=A0A1D1YAX9_9ARAE
MGSAPKHLHIVVFLTAISATVIFFLFCSQLRDDAWVVEDDRAESRTRGAGRTGAIASTSGADTKRGAQPDNGGGRQVEVVSGEDNVGGGVRSLVLDKFRVLLGLKSPGRLGYGLAPAPAPVEAAGAAPPSPFRSFPLPARGYSRSPLPRPSRIPPVEDVEVRRGATSRARARRVFVAVAVSAGAALAIATIAVALVCHRSRRGRARTRKEGKALASGVDGGTVMGGSPKRATHRDVELFYPDTFAPALPGQGSHTKDWSESESESCCGAEILPAGGSPSSDESFHSFSICDSHPSPDASEEGHPPSHPIFETPSSDGSPEAPPPRSSPVKSPTSPPVPAFAPPSPPKPPSSPHPRLGFGRRVSSVLHGGWSPSSSSGTSTLGISPSSGGNLTSPSPSPSPSPCMQSNHSILITLSSEGTASSSSIAGSSANRNAEQCPEEQVSLPRTDEPPSPLKHGEPSGSAPMPPACNGNARQPPPPPPPPFLRPPPPPPPFKKAGSPGQAPPLPPPGQLQPATPIGKDGTPLPKLKPLHWDKVRAASDRSMVWDKIRSSSFELDEEMIESLFGYSLQGSGRTEEARSKASSPSKHVLETKRLQNFTILLKALNATTEEIRKSLLRGSGLCAQQLEALVKMVPTKEEEEKLLGFEGDIRELDPAERFVRDVLSIPFSFSRIEVMLYRETFEDEVAHLRRSFGMLEEACKELRSSRLFLRLLEAVLKTGNRMNVGTTRGGARAFKLDALLKLADVKGTDGKTTLLHFVVQEIARSVGATATATAAERREDQKATTAWAAEEKEEDYRATGLELVAGLSAELRHVKTTAGVDLDALAGSVANLATGLQKLRHLLQHDLEVKGLPGGFVRSMRSFSNHAATAIGELEQDEGRVFRLVREITEYYHGHVGKEEANPLGIFVIVRDFLATLDRVCKEIRSSKGHHHSPNRGIPFR